MLGFSAAPGQFSIILHEVLKRRLVPVCLFMEVKDKISGRDLPVKKQKSFRAGCKVMHPRFGKGLVINCQGEGEREVATVVFDDNKVGIKKILTHAVHMDKI